MMGLLTKYWFILLYFSCFLIFGIALGMLIFSNSTKMRLIRKAKILNGRKRFIVFLLLFCGTIFFGYIAVGSISFMVKLASFGEKMPDN